MSSAKKLGCDKVAVKPIKVFKGKKVPKNKTVRRFVKEKYSEKLRRKLKNFRKLLNLTKDAQH
jgi:hypothetical protein